jgi:outer membrane usher protein FimD/PapC
MTMTNIGATLSSSKSNGISYSINAINTASASSTSQTLMLFANIPLDAIGSRAQNAFAGVTSTAAGLTETADYSNRTSNNIGASFSTHTAYSDVLKEQDLSVDYRSYGFDASIAASTVNGQTAERGNFKGAIVNQGGYIGTTRHIGNGTGFAVVDSGAPNATILVNDVPNGRTDNTGFGVVTGFAPFLKTNIRLDPNTTPDDFDDTSLPISSFNKAGAYIKLKKAEVNGQFVQVPGFSYGIFTVSGVDYPVTDRGAWIDLPVGEYIGSINNKQVNFSIKEQ